MPTPGEVPQEIGRAYLHALTGCLCRTVRGFTLQFTVLGHPEKTSFVGPSGKSFSFDALGRFARRPFDCEVLVESKGYKNGSGLLGEYRTFLAKSYLTSALFLRHRRDLFWFVSIVPFASEAGRRLTEWKWLNEALSRPESKEVLGGLPIDEELVRDLSERIGVCVLTDSFMKFAGVAYRVEEGDNLWSIMQLLHGGAIPMRAMPTGDFVPLAQGIASENHLSNRDEIGAGDTLTLPWFGIDW